jgi:hypothetical protein
VLGGFDLLLDLLAAPYDERAGDRFLKALEVDFEAHGVVLRLFSMRPDWKQGGDH